MASYLTSFNYGNQDISSGIDNFWLNGSLSISAVEQVNFLQRLFEQQLAIKGQTLMLFKQVMLVESTDEYQLFAKTGGGPLSKDSAIGWYVGMVKTADNSYYFALNLEMPTFKQLQAKRIDIAKAQLKKLGIL